MKNFTPFQFALAVSATSSTEAGYPEVGAAFAKALRRDMGVVEDTPEASKRCLDRRNRGKQRSSGESYGKFSLNEADECSLEHVETPERTP